jgi:gliding motility-associated-like protein
VKITDKNKCFTVERIINLVITEGVKAFDVPSAFTPSGSEPNNIFRVRGYNIKQLLEFKIYNRWGNMVFSGTDLSAGWDGTYQGKAQPVDSYVYTIKIETFDGRIESKTGTVLLLR